MPVRGIEGTVQTTNVVIIKKNMAITRKELLQLWYLVAKPEDILPNINPIGFPAPSAPVTLFFLRPSGYVASSTPIAGGFIIAVPKPSKPQVMFIAIGLGTKDVTRENRLRSTIPRRS